MATAVMVAYPEIIASGAPAAGIAYGETECAVRGVCLTFNVFDTSTWFYWWSPKFKSTEQTVREMIAEVGFEVLMRIMKDPTGRPLHGNFSKGTP